LGGARTKTKRAITIDRWSRETLKSVDIYFPPPLRQRLQALRFILDHFHDGKLDVGITSAREYLVRKGSSYTGDRQSAVRRGTPKPDIAAMELDQSISNLPCGFPESTTITHLSGRSCASAQASARAA